MLRVVNMAAQATSPMAVIYRAEGTVTANRKQHLEEEEDTDQNQASLDHCNYYFMSASICQRQLTNREISHYNKVYKVVQELFNEKGRNHLMQV